MIQALFRLDSGGQFGLGHLMRSRALADALLEQEIQCTFAIKQTHSIELIKPHQVILISDENEFIELSTKFDVIIVDHYDYTSEQFYQLSKKSSALLLIIDEECNRDQLYADIIVNPASQAISLPYKQVAPKAKLLIGTDYILMDRSFQNQKLQSFKQRTNIVICFGGSDVTNLTLPVLEVIKSSSLIQLNIVVITGREYKNPEKVSSFCHQYGFKHLHDVKNMSSVFSEARLAISAAGTTAFELARSGTPSVFAMVANNQKISINELCTHGWCSVVDCREKNKPEELVSHAERMMTNTSLAELSHKARKLVDGKGPERVASVIKKMLPD